MRAAWNKINEVGNTYGRLTVVRESPSSGPSKWVCLCICGAETTVFASNLRKGNTKSCGCLHAETVKVTNVTHGQTAGGTRTVAFKVWSSMWARCRNKSSRYASVVVCSEWSSFENFFHDMGPAGEGMTLDRKDPTAGYTPENCRWATQKEQQNNRTNNIRIDVLGVSLTIAQASEMYGVPYQRLWSRLQVLKWAPARALGIDM